MKRRGNKRWRAPACRSGKAGFRSQSAAVRAINRIARENAQAVAAPAVQPVRAYECPGCGCWHLTSKPERQS